MVGHGVDNGISHGANSAAPPSEQKIGLVPWMDRVTTELDRIQLEFNPDGVHDLRVALRRCISIADVYMAVDPLEAWREMRKMAQRLFKHLGDLRDVQVIKEWIGQLAGEQDTDGIRLRDYLGEREAKLCKRAAEAVGDFSRTEWQKRRVRLAQRCFPIPLDDPVFQLFALERWQAAHDLHRQALRNRSQASFHRLRIGLKRFRYTVENFLPQRHERWGEDLKLLQDVLGESHDLFVLWRTALQIGALADRELRLRRREQVDKENRARLLTYRSKTVGKESLWPVWRADLLRDPELRPAAEAQIRLWASYRDRDFARTLRVADLALQLFDGLQREGVIAPAGAADERSALYAAAIMHNVGTGAGGKSAIKSGYKQIRKTEPPFGFPVEAYELAALAVRFSRGTLVRPESKHLALLSEAQKQALQLLAAILCLADAFAGKDDHGIRHLEVSRMTDAVLISTTGYREEGAMVRKLAAARYPLEVVCQAPVLIRALAE